MRTFEQIRREVAVVAKALRNAGVNHRSVHFVVTPDEEDLVDDTQKGRSTVMGTHAGMVFHQHPRLFGIALCCNGDES